LLEKTSKGGARMTYRFWLPSENYTRQLHAVQVWSAADISQLLSEGYHWECDGTILVKRNDAGEVESTVEF